MAIWVEWQQLKGLCGQFMSLVLFFILNSCCLMPIEWWSESLNKKQWNNA